MPEMLIVYYRWLVLGRLYMDKSLYDWLDEMENKEYSTYDYIKKLIEKENENNNV